MGYGLGMASFNVLQALIHATIGSRWGDADPRERQILLAVRGHVDGCARRAAAYEAAEQYQLAADQVLSVEDWADFLDEWPPPPDLVVRDGRIVTAEL